MQSDLKAVKAYAQVTETLNGISIKLRYQGNTASIALAVLGAFCGALFFAFVWRNGWSVEVGLLAVLLAACAAGGIFIACRPFTVPLQMTAHTITLGQQELTWDEVVDAAVVVEANTTFLELTTKTTRVRQVFWAPPEAHAPLVRVIQAHLAQHRPAIQADSAPPEPLRKLQATGRVKS